MKNLLISLTAAIVIGTLSGQSRASCLANQELLVNLPNGQGNVVGTTINTPSGRVYYTWRKIPFAKPPVGELRFQPPVKPDSWADKTLDGTKDGPACYAASLFSNDPKPSGGYSEDCLYINVHSPTLPPRSNDSNVSLPVMVYIYGGGFLTGNSDINFYNPAPFLEEDVIVVTFNYRLTIFGYLSLGDEVLPGNIGFKDQLAALTWTKENIATFGGNSSDITIFGESAGSVGVGFHLTSPKSRGLFTKAILQSGSNLLSLWTEDPRTMAVGFTKKLDSSITDSSTSEEILEVLRNADIDQLINLVASTGIVFGPVCEKDNPTAFSTDSHHYETWEAGNFTHVPAIIGTNSQEGLIYIRAIEDVQAMAAKYDANTSLLMPYIKHLKSNASVEAITQEIKEFYVGDGNFSSDIGAALRWMTDDVFLRSFITQARLQSRFAPVYYYELSFFGTPSAHNVIIPGCGRVGHAEDLPYLFNMSNSPLKTERDFLTRRRLVKLWTNFAKTGNPTPGDDEFGVLQNVTWDQFSDDRLNYLDIGDDLQMKNGREPQQMNLWDHIWNTYADRPYDRF